MKLLRWLLVLMMGTSGLSAMGQQLPLVQAPSVPRAASVSAGEPIRLVEAPRITSAMPAFSSSCRGAIIQLIETLLHIPYIATIDSTDPTAIRVSAALAFIGNDFRLIQQLLTSRQDVTALRMLLTAAPKVFGYLLAAWYDMARMQQAECIAKDNKNDAKLLRQFNINQEVLLLFELILRVLVVVAAYADSIRDSWVQWGVGQVADWVGLWRLISRYFTILLVLERFELSVLTQPRLPEGAVRAVAPDNNAVFASDLAAFADVVQLPKQYTSGTE
jgi:hypothetical protein